MIRGTQSMDTPLARSGRLSRALKLALVGVGALVVLVAVLAPTLRRWARAEESVGRARLRLATAVRGELERDVSAQGRIVAASYPRLFSPEPGIVSIQVRPGRVVAEGDLLAVVDSPQLEAQLQGERSALASLASELERQRIDARQRKLTGEQRVDLLTVRQEAARRELDRLERLRAEGLINQVDYDRAQDELSLASLELEHAAESLKLEGETLDFELRDKEHQLERQRIAVAELERRAAQLRVTAPFAGMVATIEVQDRDAVERNQAILTVVDLSELEVEVAIPETYADDVAPGTPAAVIYDGREFPGEVVSISPEVTNSQVEARVVFRGPTPGGLKQNQRVSTRLILDRRTDVVKVPRGAYLESGGGRKIYVLEDGLAVLRPIRVGATSVSEVEILEGVEPGEVVLLSDVNQFNGARTVLVRD